MTIDRFENILAWQKAKVLTIAVYEQFKTIQDRSFRDQIQRASVSIMNNIAEGFERRSNKELRQFLYISKGSCGETRSMLVLAKEIHYLKSDVAEDLAAQVVEVSKMLSGFIKRL